MVAQNVRSEEQKRPVTYLVGSSAIVASRQNKYEHVSGMTESKRWWVWLVSNGAEQPAQKHLHLPL